MCSISEFLWFEGFIDINFLFLTEKDAGDSILSPQFKFRCLDREEESL